jgi:hypothetical protein
MKESIFELIQKPFIQFLISISLTILLILFIGNKSAEKTWTLAGLFFIGFIVINSIIICTIPNTWTYFFYSLGFSVLYLICVAVLIPFLIKKMNIEGSGESGMIFIFIIYHPLFLLFVLFLKWLYLKVF